MKPKIEVRQIYSDEFKRKVIEEYLTTDNSKMSPLFVVCSTGHVAEGLQT